MVLVKTVLPISVGYLLVTFDNNEQKIVDIKPHMKGVLEKLRDPEFFKQVFVDPELETVCWPGELDLDPDNLYKQGVDFNRIIEIASEIKAGTITYDQKNKQERA